MSPERPRPAPARQAGVTIVELLISITLLAVLVIVIGSALVPSLQITASSGRAANSTATARNVVENIQGQWSAPASSTSLTTAELAERRDRFDRTCIKLTDALSSLPSTATVSVKKIRPALTPTGTDVEHGGTLQVVGKTGTCTASVDNPTYPIKRITVTLTSNGTTSSQFTLDIRRP